MSKKLLFLGFSLGFIAFGCQQGIQQGQQERYAPPKEDYAYDEYRSWTGPGRYYRVWFYNEGDYIAWKGRRGPYRRRAYRHHYRVHPRYYPRRGWRDGRRGGWGGRRGGRRGGGRGDPLHVPSLAP